MSCVAENQSVLPPTEDGNGPKDMKSAEDFRVKLNGLSENSTVLTSQKTDGSERGKENGLVNHQTTSKSDHKPREGNHHSSSSKSSGSDKNKHQSSSSSKHKENSSSSSSKHGSSTSSSKHKDGSSSSSSKHKDGHSSSSSSKHREGSSSKHSSSSSSSKHKEGTSSSVAHSDKDKSSSSSSKPKDASSSSSDKQSSSVRPKDSSDGKQKDISDGKQKDSSDGKQKDSRPKDSSSHSKHKDSSSDRKHKDISSSKQKDGHISSSSKPKEGSSSSKEKSSSSSGTNKASSKDKSSTSSSKHNNKEYSSSGDKSKSSHRSESDKQKSSLHMGKHNSQQSESKVENDKSKEKHMLVLTTEEHSEEIKIKNEIVEPDSNNLAISSQLSPVKKELSPVKKEELSSTAKTGKPTVSSISQQVIKSEEKSEDDDDDKPLSVRKKKESKPTKRPVKNSNHEENEERYDDEEEDEDSDVPLSARNKAKKMKLDKKPVKKEPVKAKPVAATTVKKNIAVKNKKEIKDEAQDDEPVKKKKKGEDDQEVWKWWEETKGDSSIKWTYLEHKGPMFAPAYEPLPKNVRFYYDGKPMELSLETEEVATFYGRMLDHEYTSRDVFNNNFMKDWRKVMTAKEKAEITNIKLCNFHEILDYFKKKSEERKGMSKEGKQQIKKENEEIVKEYGYCIIDHHKEKIGNFRIEPPSLFRGRGNHPKQGMLKKRTNPEDVIINCSKDSKIPAPPTGHKWKEVRHDNTVTWLASWTENVQGSTKYVMLNAASKLKGEKDWQKYETARKLHKCVDKIRAQYQEDWKSKEMRVRQRAVALYFIDKLALRAGNEKEEGETADTVGCCSLRVEHIKLHDEKDGKQNVVEFDFLGKDSIRYQNAIPVEKRVYKNVQLFMENKQPEDDLFDRLNTTILNKHLQELMDGLTAKVFRTFNASKTLSEQLELLTNSDDSVAAKLLAYNRANRAVAILCNHQRAVPKTFEKSMENLMNKIDAKKSEIKQVKKQIKEIKADYKREKSVRTKTMYDKKKKVLARLEEQLVKIEVQATDKDENKEIALGTSKLNYLDPRISVAWCKKFGVPIEKVYNKTQRDKFRWAIDMATDHFKF